MSVIEGSLLNNQHLKGFRNILLVALTSRGSNLNLIAHNVSEEAQDETEIVACRLRYGQFALPLFQNQGNEFYVPSSRNRYQY